MITPFTEIEKMEILDLTGKYLCHDASEAIIVSHRETVQNDFHISIRRVKGDSMMTEHYGRFWELLSKIFPKPLHT